MTNRPAGGVGARLRRQREEQGISLRDIAGTTKISPVALEAIERDDIRRLPGGIFLRAFVRAYASSLGLDGEATLREFVGQFPEVAAEHFPRPAPAGDPEPARPAVSGRLLVQLALVTVPLLLALVWFLLARSSETDSTVVGGRIAALSTDTPAPGLIRPVADVGSEALPEAVPAVDHVGELSIVLTPTADCWVSASIDGRSVVERLFAPGEQLVLKAHRSVVFKVGDAAAVSLQVNGINGRDLGRPGEVVTTRIDQDNFREFFAAN